MGIRVPGIRQLHTVCRKKGDNVRIHSIKYLIVCLINSGYIGGWSSSHSATLHIPSKKWDNLSMFLGKYMIVSLTITDNKTRYMVW
jgi:hypothetical protein